MNLQAALRNIRIIGLLMLCFTAGAFASIYTDGLFEGKSAHAPTVKSANTHDAEQSAGVDLADGEKVKDQSINRGDG